MRRKQNEHPPVGWAVLLVFAEEVAPVQLTWWNAPIVEGISKEKQAVPP